MPAFPKPPAKEKTPSKICGGCKVKRDLRFFKTRLTRLCVDCQKSAAYQKHINRPASKNKKADTEWSLKVKERDGFKCAYCGRIDTLNSHHIFSRRHEGLRWDIDNGITLCAGHHNFSTQFSAHKTPVEFVEWIKELKGEEWYNRLRTKAKMIMPKYLYK